ncbi:MAG TPA: GrpB family protein [Gemmatimonadaceae bacterium]|nr:GrpB family protein [Gemmatimonadaceae bacterium]
MPLLVPSDPTWPAEFEAEAARIERACDDLEVRLEHIGSTAVPGLLAKPVIDILAGVPPRARRREYVVALRGIGYEHLGAHGIAGRDYLRRGSPRSHHVHLVSWSSAFWREHLAFRDWLRAHPETAAEYEILKRELARRAELEADPRLYQEEKGPFVRSVVRQALAES